LEGGAEQSRKGSLDTKQECCLLFDTRKSRKRKKKKKKKKKKKMEEHEGAGMAVSD
jgi:hypothetical protein